jgi:hypothetical protein
MILQSSTIQSILCGHCVDTVTYFFKICLQDLIMNGSGYVTTSYVCMGSYKFQDSASLQWHSVYTKFHKK